MEVEGTIKKIEPDQSAPGAVSIIVESVRRKERVEVYIGKPPHGFQVDAWAGGRVQIKGRQVRLTGSDPQQTANFLCSSILVFHP
jgi:hypothetical protein